MGWSEAARLAALEARRRSLGTRALRTGFETQPVLAVAPVTASTPSPVVEKVVPLRAASPDSTGYYPPADYPFILDSMRRCLHVMLVGPTGCGKTALGKKLARDLGRPFRRQNFNGQTTVDNLVGYTELRNDNGVPVTQKVYGQLALAMLEGAVYLADELDAGLPEVLFQLHRPLEVEDNHPPTLEIGGEIITAKPGFAVVGGTNTLGRGDDSGIYHGTNLMNRALLDRFVGGVFKLDYVKHEAALLVGVGCPPHIASKLSRFAFEIRARAKRERAEIVLSTRTLLSVGADVSRWGVATTLRFKVMNLLTDDEKLHLDACPTFKELLGMGDK